MIFTNVVFTQQGLLPPIAWMYTQAPDSIRPITFMLEPGYQAVFVQVNGAGTIPAIGAFKDLGANDRSGGQGCLGGCPGWSRGLCGGLCVRGCSGGSVGRREWWMLAYSVGATDSVGVKVKLGGGEVRLTMAISGEG